MPLVTVDDVATYMDVTFSNVQEDAAAFVIDGLQSELEAYLRRPIELVEATETYRIPDDNLSISSRVYYSALSAEHYVGSDAYNVFYYPIRTIYLKTSPVVSVDELTVTKPSVGAVPQLKAESTDFIVRPYGIDLLNAYANDLVTVTYTGGLDGSEIKIFKLLILRAATREMQNMHDDVVGLKDLTTRNVAPLDTGFTDRELASVKRYRRVQV